MIGVLAGTILIVAIVLYVLDSRGVVNVKEKAQSTRSMFGGGHGISNPGYATKMEDDSAA